MNNGSVAESEQSIVKEEVSDTEEAEKDESETRESSEKQDVQSEIENEKDKTQVNTEDQTTTTGVYSTLDDVEQAVINDTEETISGLNDGWDELCGKIGSYDDYNTYFADVEAYYSKALDVTTALSGRMYAYALEYAEIIINSDDDYDDMYDDLDEIYDVIYDDACEDIYDEIYDGILDEMYDEFYDGVIDDAYDTVPYKEWSAVHSDEYDMWSDTRSDVYDVLSDTRSDIYDFWSDLRSDIWDDDIESAKERIEDFRKDVSKMQ